MSPAIVDESDENSLSIDSLIDKISGAGDLHLDRQRSSFRFDFRISIPTSINFTWIPRRDFPYVRDSTITWRVASESTFVRARRDKTRNGATIIRKFAKPCFTKGTSDFNVHFDVFCVSRHTHERERIVGSDGSLSLSGHRPSHLVSKGIPLSLALVII